MLFEELRSYIVSDHYRCYGFFSRKKLIYEVFFGEGLKYLFWMRTAKYLRNKNSILGLLAMVFLRQCKYKFNIDIPFQCEIGKGFYIGHIGSIVVSSKAIIGNNCNISQGVTIGKSNRGSNPGYPIIGDNVFIGPGAKIIGNIKVGDNVAIGANAVVTKSVPDNAVVAGIPAAIISMNGSKGYINKKFI